MEAFVQHAEALSAKGVKVNCVVDTKAMSAGFDILQQACQERLMTDRSVVLSHQAAATLQGKRRDLEDQMDRLEKVDKARLNQEAKRLGMPLEELLQHLALHDWSLSADEALAVNAVDAIVDPKTLPPPYELEKPEEKPGVLNFLFK